MLDNPVILTEVIVWYLNKEGISSKCYILDFPIFKTVTLSGYNLSTTDT